MLFLVVALAISLIISISLGTSFIRIMDNTLPNSVALQKDNYTIVDRFLIGLFCVTFLLQIWNIFLPINIYCLFFFSLLTIICITIELKRSTDYLKHLKKRWKEISFFQYIISAILLIGLLGISLWQSDHYDAEFYHIQNMFWMENYPLLKGLANLEHRYGFNSNYLMLSTLFLFNKGIFDEPIFTLNLALAILILIFSVSKISSDGKNLNSFILFFFTFVLLLFNDFRLATTSTDLFPSIIIIYLAYKLIESITNSKKEATYLFIVVPLLLCTVKLSFAPLILLSVYQLYSIFKKSYKTSLYLFISISFVFISYWLIRNVIVSGYCIFPIAFIDIFDVDWKVPIEIAIMEKNFIYIFPFLFITELYPSKFEISKLINLAYWKMLLPFIASFAVIIGSLFFVTKGLLKKQKNYSLLSTALVSALCCITISYISGPAPRFFIGVTFFALYLLVSIFL